MTSFGIALLVAVGIALIVWRRPAAHWQGLTMGGRKPPGCAVAEGILQIEVAVILFAIGR